MSIYDIEVKTIDGEQTTLAAYQNQVMLIVNTASKCGLTPQYEGLQHLYDQYKDQGLVVLGFPCNQFAGQEPGTEQEIKSFCQTQYHVTFPMFSKIDVNGENRHPLYDYLLQHAQDTEETGDVEWNFAKFLVDREGHVVKRFASKTKPASAEKDIQALL